MKIEVTNATINFTDQESVSVSINYSASAKAGQEFLSGTILAPLEEVKSMKYSDLQEAVKEGLIARLSSEDVEGEE